MALLTCVIPIVVLYLPDFASHSNSCNMRNLDGFVVDIVYEIWTVLICLNENLISDGCVVRHTGVSLYKGCNIYYNKL